MMDFQRGRIYSLIVGVSCAVPFAFLAWWLRDLHGWPVPDIALWLFLPAMVALLTFLAGRVASRFNWWF